MTAHGWTLIVGILAILSCSEGQDLSELAKDNFQVKLHIVTPCVDEIPETVKHVSKGDFNSCADAKHLCESTASMHPFCMVTCGVCSKNETKELTLQVHYDWAPNAAAAFRTMVEKKLLDGQRFWRLEDHVIYFGAMMDAQAFADWAAMKNRPSSESVPRIQWNDPGTIAFKNVEDINQATTEILINLERNDKRQDFAPNRPFAEFAFHHKGMEIVKGFFQGYGTRTGGYGGVDFGEYLVKNFPKLSYISKARILKKKKEKKASSDEL